MLLLLLACRPEPLIFCEGPVKMWYEPDPSGELTVFPDDHWTEAADTPTGLQVDMHSDTLSMLAAYPENFVGIFDDISTLDGFGLSSGIWMRALDPLPTLSEDQVVLWAGGERWPVELKNTDGGETVLIWPRYPLPEASEVVAVLTTDPEDPQCISPSAYTRSLLDPSTEDPPVQSVQFQTALESTGIAPEQVAGITVFTTQSATRVSRLVAEDIAHRDYATDAPAVCTQKEGYRECNATLTVQDYRTEDHIVPADTDGSSLSSYGLPLRIWLPDSGIAPYPTVLCGHGLGGDKGQCELRG